MTNARLPKLNKYVRARIVGVIVSTIDAEINQLLSRIFTVELALKVYKDSVCPEALAHMKGYEEWGFKEDHLCLKIVDLETHWEFARYVKLVTPVLIPEHLRYGGFYLSSSSPLFPHTKVKEIQALTALKDVIATDITTVLDGIRKPSVLLAVWPNVLDYAPYDFRDACIACGIKPAKSFRKSSRNFRPETVAYLARLRLTSESSQS